MWLGLTVIGNEVGGKGVSCRGKLCRHTSGVDVILSVRGSPHPRGGLLRGLALSCAFPNSFKGRVEAGEEEP